MKNPILSEKTTAKVSSSAKSPFTPWLKALALGGTYFLVEIFACLILKPPTLLPLAFSGAWAVLLTAICFALPKVAGRLVYGVSYYIFALWTAAQTGYFQMFGKIMWLSDIRYADEGAGYADVLLGFSALWWVGLVVLVGLGVVGIFLIPGNKKGLKGLIPSAIAGGLSIIALLTLPFAVYAMDNDVWGTHSEYAQSSSAKASYTVMYDSRSVYDLCGMYQLTMKDLWKNELYPLTPAYRREVKESIKEIDQFFLEKGHDDNEMTGALAGKNVILVLMESMDDWLITQEETPTICKLMDEGINFTNFYTPGYGSVRTFNTEFCTNTGVFLPTTGSYVFNYVTNAYDQSLANRLKDAGYSAQCFHYNSPDFYSRGVFEPAMGYSAYNSFEDYTDNENDLYSETYFLDNPEMRDLFFREDPTFNFIITRSAHLSYVYRELLSVYALDKYPEYRGKFGHEEVDCARVKAKLVDDLFTRLLQELEQEGQLENTVIIGITDHYTYGFKDTKKLMELSGVDHELLLEKTPCFIWSKGGPSITVDKTLSTADMMPTLVNLLGLSGDEKYLGQDAFDPDYTGYAIFPNGSWITQGVACAKGKDGKPEIVQNLNNVDITKEFCGEMDKIANSFIAISNDLLTSDYYAQVDFG